jgi:hypothetical protein
MPLFTKPCGRRKHQKLVEGAKSAGENSVSFSETPEVSFWERDGQAFPVLIDDWIASIKADEKSNAYGRACSRSIEMLNTA